MPPQIGFIGLGTIGLPMAERLLAQGLPLTVWNRTPERTRELAAKGASVANTPRELADRCDMVITMVSDGAALREVAQRADGIAAGLAAGKTHLDMSTIDVGTSAEMAAFYVGRKAHFVHAPVLGNKRHAAAGELLIFAGGPAAAVEKCRPIFKALGKRTWTWERPQQATCTKLACNLLLGGMIELLSESLALVSNAGNDPRTLIEILGMSALGAPMFQAKGSLMADHNFATSFYLRHMLKDLRLAAEAGAGFGLVLPATHAIGDVYGAAAEAGYADADYSSVMKWIEGGRTV
jgi:3-hydroxyisobutyrate dehydrogenase-like beta-hydroxyacid dehydrogenase